MADGFCMGGVWCQALVSLALLCQTLIAVDCDYELWLPTSRMLSKSDYRGLNISYSGAISTAKSHTWCVSAAPNRNISLYCPQFHIPINGNDCKMGAMQVLSNNKTRSYCGNLPFQADINSNRMTIVLHSELNKSTSQILQVNISCEIKLVRAKIAVQMIVGGISVKSIKDFPFMVGITTSNGTNSTYPRINDDGSISMICGASIVSPRHVLTAAHCLKLIIANKTLVVAGLVNRFKDPSQIKNVIEHENYNSKQLKNDIALLELASIIAFSSRIMPVNLPPFDSPSSDLTTDKENLTVVGWGSRSYGEQQTEDLHIAEIKTSDIRNCTEYYRSKITDGDTTQFCAYTEGKDACQRDSGGPWLRKNNYSEFELVGLVSEGIGCAYKFPSLNTKVAPFYSWICNHIQVRTPKGHFDVPVPKVLPQHSPVVLITDKENV